MENRVFIGSSTEALPAAKAIQDIVGNENHVVVWKDLFETGQIIVDSLLKRSGEFDYAIFIYTPDDLTTKRGTDVKTVRDNVVFETGLFMSKLGRDRVFVLVPEGARPHILSDLDGLVHESYVSPQAPSGPADWVANLSSVCIKLQALMDAPVPPTAKRCVRAISGRWAGTVTQPAQDMTRSLEEFGCDVTFIASVDSVHGEMRITGDLTEEKKEAVLKLVGHPVDDGFLKLDYNYVAMPGSLQFGNLILEIDPLGTKLSGMYCGFGPFLGKIVYGQINLRKLT